MNAYDYDGILDDWNSTVKTAYYYPGDVKTYPFYWETADLLNTVYKNNFYQGSSSAHNQ